MYIYENKNPKGKRTNDCVIRAIAKIMGMPWEDVFIRLSNEALLNWDLLDANYVWIGWLKKHGFRMSQIPDSCPRCYSVRQFCRDNPEGSYILGTGTHAVAVIDGDYYDTFDSGDLVPIFYLRRG